MIFQSLVEYAVPGPMSHMTLCSALGIQYSPADAHIWHLLIMYDVSPIVCHMVGVKSELVALLYL
jgi:hypothetical protein